MTIGTPTLTGYRNVTRTPLAPIFGFLGFYELGLLILGERFWLSFQVFWFRLYDLCWKISHFSIEHFQRSAIFQYKILVSGLKYLSW